MYPLSDSGQYNLGAAASMMAIASLSVILRFSIRIFTRQGIKVSDWIMLFALVLMFAYTAVMIQYIVGGPGYGSMSFPELIVDAEKGHNDWLIKMLQAMYTEELLFMSTITAVKLSILAFYHHMFAISIPFRRVNLAAIIICCIWAIVFLCLSAFQCRPIHALWDSLGSPEYCIASGRIWLGAEITNLAIDVMLLVMPLFVIKRLNLPNSRKYSLGGIFLLGGLACIASIVKLCYVWNPSDQYLVDAGPTMEWSSIQLGVAILSACLPTFAPLLRILHEKLRSTIPRSDSDTYETDERSKTLINAAGMSGSTCYSMDRSKVRTNVASDMESYHMGAMPPNTIYVKNTIDVD